MRIVIDMQGAQGSNRQRGIGRYTLSLAQAIVRNCGEHEVFLVLNDLFPDTIETIRAAFDGLMPQENIRVWQIMGPVCSADNENDWRRRSAELVREAFLASLKPDIVLVSSLFEGLVDDVVTSIGMLSCNIPTAVVLYDLIPLIQRRPYLENPVVEGWYENKLDHLRRANLLLAISESSRQEGIRYLGFPDDACINISTAADQQFRPQQIDSREEQEIRQRYGLSRPFVMYTGGIDHRKNIEGLIRAYAMLPKATRTAHQLAIVCSIQPASRNSLEKLAREQGLTSDDLVLTGFVPEEDLLALYNLCKAFIFPSWHEGFGLPALEAMSCARAVIGANTSSLPEVIGREDALFNPMSDRSIAEKLEEVLVNDVFRSELERHGLEQAKRFSWDYTAQQAIAAFEAWHSKKISHSLTDITSARRPKLAYISPLPPERSGISDYSAELLPELARYYDIDVIVAQDSVSDPWIRANCLLRTVEWFRAHSDRYERVLYHFGNSHFHQHMFGVLEDVPGIVVLHDFFLSGIAAHMDVTGYRPNYWVEALYQGHGYAPVQQRFHVIDTADIVWRYPCNLEVLRQALGIIVHSQNSRRLASLWHGQDAADDWEVIPHLRILAQDIDRAKARSKLGLDENDFVVCSFGLIGPTKLNQRLLDAWLASGLAKDPNCVLVFVGENDKGGYGRNLTTTIMNSGLAKRIRITGWADTETFRQYLMAADVGVQLRTLSRGETSGTVLDCMNYGLATIVNANGSMADLPDDVVFQLSDEFENSELSHRLEILWKNAAERDGLGARAREHIRTRHDPCTCAAQYARAIESFYYRSATDKHALIQAIAGLDEKPRNDVELIKLADCIAKNLSPMPSQKQLFVDVSELIQRDARSGIQRVVRSVLRELLQNPPEGYRVEPVYATLEHGYRYARQFTLKFLECPDSVLSDGLIEYQNGDIFLGLDLQPQVIPAQRAFYQQLRRDGVLVQFVVYDLLCILSPQFFGEGALEGYQRWLEVVAESDGAICISKSVANELSDWLEAHGQKRYRPFNISWFHLGADVKSSVPSGGLPNNADTVLNSLYNKSSFLMVGTIEPRKGHAQVVSAFEKLWVEGMDINLVIVGKQGWMVEALADKLRHHAELGKHLFWLEGISDEYLEKIYAASTCLIAASEGEGFGLPLIEAAQHKLPIIARDIPVFREVAGDHAFYFKGQKADSIKKVLVSWLSLNAQGKSPSAEGMKWLTWKDSVQQLMAKILPTLQTKN